MSRNAHDSAVHQTKGQARVLMKSQVLDFIIMNELSTKGYSGSDEMRN